MTATTLFGVDVTDAANRLRATVESPAVCGHKIAWDRPESDPCERGTTGCCVDHTASRGVDCDCW